MPKKKSDTKTAIVAFTLMGLVFTAAAVAATVLAGVAYRLFCAVAGV